MRNKATGKDHLILILHPSRGAHAPNALIPHPLLPNSSSTSSSSSSSCSSSCPSTQSDNSHSARSGSTMNGAFGHGQVDSMTQCPYGVFPLEVWMIINGFLQPEQLAKMCAVNRSFQVLSSHPKLWERCMLARFGISLKEFTVRRTRRKGNGTEEKNTMRSDSRNSPRKGPGKGPEKSQGYNDTDADVGNDLNQRQVSGCSGSCSGPIRSSRGMVDDEMMDVDKYKDKDKDNDKDNDKGTYFEDPERELREEVRKEHEGKEGSETEDENSEKEEDEELRYLSPMHIVRDMTLARKRIFESVSAMEQFRQVQNVFNSNPQGFWVRRS